MMNWSVRDCRSGAFSCIRAFAAAITLAMTGSLAHAQTADVDHVLVLDQYICRGDMRTIADCLNRQNDKADRWLDAVVESYARLAAAYVAEAKGTEGAEPFDQVAQLRDSQVLFEQFRDATAELAYRTGYPGSGSALEGARARFQLTTDRARFLIRICNSRRSADLTYTVDLTVVNWCQHP